MEWRRRWYANFVNLSTPLGLLIAAAGRARLRPGPRGLILAEGYRWRFPDAVAFTVGNVVLTGSDFDRLRVVLPEVLAHEERHSTQWARWVGLPFLPAYGAALAWSWLRTGDRAAYNRFEQEAGLVAGGYRPADG
ncbi:hypothetical protein [Granulicoccus phenolivorans]|uniref:hypothetical protein n=1 Tax=Granulicoccus phenolivorans TaxID=266854 RepID=UPI00042A5252|nr:hypothetical protein [Granulicoccus phenolivorans]